MPDRLERIARLHDRYALTGYREFAEGSESRYGVPQAFRTITEQNRLPLERWSVLDLGCGPGNLIGFSNFKSYSGVDLSTEMLAEAGESGYKELVEANIAEYVANPYLGQYDAVVAFSCAYFIPPEEILAFLENVNRIAKHFWMVTLDGITPAVRETYRKRDGIDVYDHRGLALPWPDTRREAIYGWRSHATREDIPMEVVYRIN